MPFRLQQIDPDSKFCQHLQLPFLERCYPREVVSEVLSQCQAWEKRERKLNQLVMVYYVIALSLFPRCNITAVFAHLCRGLRWIWPDPCMALPTGGALSARRESLGIIVMRRLFRQCCRPLATEHTQGAFAFGLRLMAIDSTLDEVPDTLTNALHFGRLCSGKSQSPYPQVRCLYLIEVGTHAVVDALFARCKASEQAMTWALLRSIQSGMLVLGDRNFPSMKWLAAVQQQGAHLLCRLKAGIFTNRDCTLADGSYLVTLYPNGKKQASLTVRVIEYRIHPRVARDLADMPTSRTSDRANPLQVHRLVTTLLDPQQAPALELVCAYHERWEIELAIDEMKNHQRLSGQPLRSKTPEFIYQELYGLVMAHYAIRAWMHEAAVQGDLNPDRLSFTHALEIMDTACYELAKVSQEELPYLQARILADLRDPQKLLPVRRLRFCPRVVKVVSSTFYRQQGKYPSIRLKNVEFCDILLI
jgi:Insertion element 4 transposase N-terminal/Transposase DDE domain